MPDGVQLIGISPDGSHGLFHALAVAGEAELNVLNHFAGMSDNLGAPYALLCQDAEPVEIK